MSDSINQTFHYILPLNLFNKYGGIHAYPWEIQFNQWKLHYPELGIFYILSNRGWTGIQQDILKMGISNSIGPGRINSYNGTNILSCNIEFMCICSNVKLLEDKMKEDLAFARFSVRGHALLTEWVILTRSRFLDHLFQWLDMDSKMWLEQGIPMYHVRLERFLKISDDSMNQQYWQWNTEPFREQNSCLYLSPQEQMYVALFQHIRGPFLETEITEVHAKLMPPQRLFQQHLTHANSFLSLNHESFSFLQFQPSDINPDVWARQYNEEHSRESREIQVSDEYDQTDESKVSEACQGQDPINQHALTMYSLLQQQLCQLQSLQSPDDSSNDVVHSMPIRDKTKAPKYMMWTPREEWTLLNAIHNWPNQLPLSWNALYDKHKHELQPYRRPFDLSNKWKDINLRTPDRIWPTISNHKRVHVNTDPQTGQVVKRVRRNISQLRQDERWCCPNAPCTTTYCKTSTVSIQEHLILCDFVMVSDQVMAQM